MATPNYKRIAAAYQTENEQAAELILSDPATYPDESLQALWARLILAQRERWELTA